MVGPRLTGSVHFALSLSGFLSSAKLNDVSRYLVFIFPPIFCGFDHSPPSNKDWYMSPLFSFLYMYNILPSGDKPAVASCSEGLLIGSPILVAGNHFPFLKSDTYKFS